MIVLLGFRPPSPCSMAKNIMFRNKLCWVSLIASSFVFSRALLWRMSIYSLQLSLLLLLLLLLRYWVWGAHSLISCVTLPPLCKPAVAHSSILCTSKYLVPMCPIIEVFFSININTQAFFLFTARVANPS